MLRALRGSIVSWVGILGGAVTLFGNLDAMLSLAEWARWLVDNWHTWLRVGWKHVFDLLGIKDSSTLRIDLTFGLFLLTTAAGSRLEIIRAGLPTPPLNWWSFLRTSLSVGCAVIGYAIVSIAIERGILPGLSSGQGWGVVLSGALLWGLLFLAVMHWPAPAALGTATLLQAFLFLLFYSHDDPSEVESTEYSLWVSVAVIGVGCFLAFWLAVPNKFHARLWYMLCAVLVLVALNYLSQLQLTLR